MCEVDTSVTHRQEWQKKGNKHMQQGRTHQRQEKFLLSGYGDGRWKTESKLIQNHQDSKILLQKLLLKLHLFFFREGKKNKGNLSLKLCILLWETPSNCNRWFNPNHTLLWLLPGTSQRGICPQNTLFSHARAQAQVKTHTHVKKHRGTMFGGGTPVTLSEDTGPCPAPPLAVPGGTQPPCPLQWMSVSPKAPFPHNMTWGIPAEKPSEWWH